MDVKEIAALADRIAEGRPFCRRLGHRNRRGLSLAARFAAIVQARQKSHQPVGHEEDNEDQHDTIDEAV